MSKEIQISYSITILMMTRGPLKYANGNDKALVLAFPKELYSLVYKRLGNEP